MTPPELHIFIPGALDQRTGGFIYDARMVTELRRLGWHVEVLSLEGSFPDADPPARRSLSAALESLPDGSTVVIDGLAMGGLPGPVRANGERLRILSLVHHPLADETGLSREDQQRFRDSERDALRACAGVIVTSAFTARRLSDYGIADDRIRAVRPGTEAARFAEGPGGGTPPRLVCVATVTQRKGYDVLIAALDRVSDLSWTCVCAGSLDRDRAYVRSVFDQVAETDVTNRIDFVGEYDDDALDELYHGASIFVLASHYEGYGMALAEALARGLPVVSTTGGAIPFTVPADAGILVDPGDSVAFAAALRSLLTDPRTRRDELAAAARRHAGELPTWEAAARVFATAVEELAR